MRKWIIAVVVIVVLAAAGYFFLNSQGDGAPGALFSPEGEATPTPLPVIEANNQVIADAVVVPLQDATLSFAAGGSVQEILVAEGDMVDAGDLIARLDNERQVIAVAQAEASVRRAQARLDELRNGARPEEIASSQASLDAAKANLANLQEGSRPEDVAAAEAGLAAARARLQQVLDGADEADIINAKANLRNAEAELQRAQNAFNEVKWRTDSGALPQAADLQRATNNYEAAQAQLNRLLDGATDSEIAAARAEVQQAEANLEKAKAPATQAQIDAAQADVDRAEADLALRKAGTREEAIRQAEADLTQAATELMQRQADLADTELRAPFAGTVASIDLKIGEQVAAAAPVVALADMTNWLLETDDLTEIGIVNINVGDPATITFDALPDVELTGMVTAIRPLGESRQGDITYTVTVVPDSNEERLRWNMTASVTIEPEE